MNLVLLSAACFGGMWSDAVNDLNWGVVAMLSQPVEAKHTGEPLAKPRRIAHRLSQSGCSCPMCLGSHLVNRHGLKLRDWDRLGFARNHGAALRFHCDEHNRLDPPAKRICPSGVCRPGGSCPRPAFPFPFFRGLFRR